jgi:DNA-binding MarR family transcriptional regulator
MDGFEFEDLDEVIHGRVRLGIMAFLSTSGGADFTTLKTRLQLTDGNLSVHIKKLEEAGYIATEKAFVGRKPQTSVKITPKGRTAFAAYLEAIGKLVG